MLYRKFIRNAQFILTVKGDFLILNSTYGGQEGIINKRFNKKEWLKTLKHLNKNNYNKQFGIKEKIKGYINITEISYTYLPIV